MKLFSLTLVALLLAAVWTESWGLSCKYQHGAVWGRGRSFGDAPVGELGCWRCPIPVKWSQNRLRHSFSRCRGVWACPGGRGSFLGLS